jgi:hypothetical protein
MAISWRLQHIVFQLVTHGDIGVSKPGLMETYELLGVVDQNVNVTTLKIIQYRKQYCQQRT